MKRALWSIFGLVVLSTLVYYVMTHPNLDRIEHLDSELQKLKEENRRLSDQNAELRGKVEALRDDPRLAERRAREVGGLAKPTEIIFQFEKPRGHDPVKVKLRVQAESCELAGNTLNLAQLGAALEKLKKEVPEAALDIRFEEDVDAIRRQRVLDVVTASPITAD